MRSNNAVHQRAYVTSIGPLQRAAMRCGHDYVVHIHLRSGLKLLNEYGEAIQSMFYAHLPQMDQAVHTELCSKVLKLPKVPTKSLTLVQMNRVSQGQVAKSPK